MLFLKSLSPIVHLNLIIVCTHVYIDSLKRQKRTIKRARGEHTFIKKCTFTSIKMQPVWEILHTTALFHSLSRILSQRFPAPSSLKVHTGALTLCSQCNAHATCRAKRCVGVLPYVIHISIIYKAKFPFVTRNPICARQMHYYIIYIYKQPCKSVFVRRYEWNAFIYPSAHADALLPDPSDDAAAENFWESCIIDSGEVAKSARGGPRLAAVNRCFSRNMLPRARRRCYMPCHSANRTHLNDLRRYACNMQPHVPCKPCVR